MKKPLIILVVLFSLAFAETAVSDSTIIGVLEKPQCKEEINEAVRALFVKIDKKWIPLETEEVFNKYVSQHMTWTIAFDGRKAGNVKTIDQGFHTKYEWTFSRDRILTLSQEQKIPHFQNKSERFSGWCWPPSIRPVVVFVNGNVSDPDIWKRAQPSANDLDVIFIAFKAKIGALSICPNSSEKEIPFSYTVKDIEVLRSYRDKSNRMLVSLRLKRIKETNFCGEVSLDDAWSAHYFLLSKKATYIGSGLELVDAGDYDSDGQSEIVFWYSGYNRDGYILFCDNFSSKVEYLWGYH
jgi:hypothetical protein